MSLFDHSAAYLEQFDPLAPTANQLTGHNYRITVLSQALLRFEYSEDGQFEDRPSTFAVNRKFPEAEFEVQETASKLEIRTKLVYVQYYKGPFTPSSLHVSFREDIGVWPPEWRFGGDRVDNLGGTIRTLDEVDGKPSFPLDDGILSKAGITWMDDSTSMLLEKDGWIGTRTPGRVDGYLFCHGREYKWALIDFFTLSGKPPVPPRFTLGNWYTRFFPYTSDGYLEVMSKFAQDNIPLSVSVIDIAWHLMDNVPKGYGGPWSGFTWEKKLYPDPPALLAELHRRGLHVALNNHMNDGIRGFEEKYAQVCRHVGRDASTDFPVPFDSTDKAFLEAYFDIVLRGHEDIGVDLWWVDWQQGVWSKTPGVDPLWMLNHFHFLDRSRRNGREPATLSRYAGPGSHRYPLGFSGDTYTTWKSLAYQPEFTATAANIGYGWWSHDIGGHLPGYKDDELMVRWFQLGAWSPVLRMHCSNNPFTTREPWRFNTEARHLMGDALRLRHRLIPYMYTMAVEGSEQGRCLVTPMYHEHPFCDDAYEHRNQFYFGTQLLVAPITAPREKTTTLASATAWLPRKMVDIFTGMVYDGDRCVTLHRPLDLSPVLAAEGAIIPLDNFDASSVKNGVDLPERLEVVVVVGANGKFTLIEGDTARTEMTFDQESGTLTIGATSAVPTRHWSVRMPGFRGDVTATVDGEPASLSVMKDARGVSASMDDAAACTSTVCVHFGARPALGANDVSTLCYARIDAAQILLDVKWKVWDAIKDQKGVVAVQRLAGMEIDEHVRRALFEVLLAVH